MDGQVDRITTIYSSKYHSFIDLGVCVTSITRLLIHVSCMFVLKYNLTVYLYV